MQPKVELLGHIVDSVGVSVDPSKIEAIRMAQVTTKATELPSFFGLAGYFRRFVKFFADTCADFHAQTSGKGPIKRNTEMDKTFVKIKGVLT